MGCGHTISAWRSAARRILWVAPCVLLGACSSLSYYAHAVNGELDVLAQRRPIADVVDDPHTAAAERAQLRTALQARDFAVHTLHLPDNGSYRSYADLKRPYPLWNVVAAPALSLEPVPQCYWVVGCATYRGFFSQRAADEYAATQRARGLDVVVVPVAAYSTLGWFDDPIFNSMLNRGEARLVGVLFHELAHQELFVKNDSAFNESFAVAVEREGLRLWFAAHDDAAAYRAYLADRGRERELQALLNQARLKLRTIYAGSADSAAKLRAKQATFRQLHDDYVALKRRWHGDTRYDVWMAQDMNNAKLALVATYHSWVPAFTELLVRNGGDLPKFYAAARQLAALPASERERRLAALSQQAAIQRVSGQRLRNGDYVEKGG